MYGQRMQRMDADSRPAFHWVVWHGVDIHDRDEDESMQSVLESG